MTENEFIEFSKSIGVREESIKSYLSNFQALKEKTLPDIELDEYLASMVLELQNKNDNQQDGMVALD